MKKIKINHLLEYLSLPLILSYFLIHNIFLVVIGIIFSLYLINANYINILLKPVLKKIIDKNISNEMIKNYKATKSDSNQLKLTKEVGQLSLVETIEELGFIPSIDETKDSNPVWKIYKAKLNLFIYYFFVHFTKRFIIVNLD